MEETSFARLPLTFYVELLRHLGRFECLSLFAVAVRSENCKTLLEVYKHCHFDQEKEADTEVESSVFDEIEYGANPNALNIPLVMEVKISSFVCDRTKKLFRPRNVCARRKAHNGNADAAVPECDGLMRHSLALEQIIDPSSQHFYCFSCLKRVKRRPVFLEKYIGQCMLYCHVCLTLDFMITERALEEDHGVPRSMQRDRLRLHTFDLYVEHDMQQLILLRQLQLDSQNGPIIAFQRRRNGSTPHIYYWKGDIKRIKAMFDERAIVSKDTQNKRIRKEADVKRKIDELSFVLAEHGYVIKRLTLEEAPAKRVKEIPPSTS